MELTPNKLYQMKTTNSECFGCILQGLSDDRGAIVHRAWNCSRLTQCVFTNWEKTWVEITEEQAMEAMLGG